MFVGSGMCECDGVRRVLSYGSGHMTNEKGLTRGPGAAATAEGGSLRPAAKENSYLVLIMSRHQGSFSRDITLQHCNGHQFYLSNLCHIV